jgi:hypothetical protein
LYLRLAMRRPEAAGRLDTGNQVADDLLPEEQAHPLAVGVGREDALRFVDLSITPRWFRDVCRLFVP